MGHLQPLNIFLRQEIDRMQRVVTVVRNTLNELKLAIDGTIIMSENLRDALDSIYDARIPATWKRVSTLFLRQTIRLEIVESSTKPEVHNVVQRQRRTELLPQITCTEYFVKFGRTRFWICQWTDRQTDTDTMMVILSIASGAKVYVIIMLVYLRWKYNVDALKSQVKVSRILNITKYDNEFTFRI